MYINFLINNFELIIVLILVLMLLFSILYSWKERKNILNKVAKQSSNLVFTESEYNLYKEQAEAVLINTTVSFLGNSLDESNDKMDSYYKTVKLGNQIMTRYKSTISDIGEI